MNQDPLLAIHEEVTHCEKCPRLRRYCVGIAKKKKKAYQNEHYWGKAISGFGDSQAELVILGLAPGAHGANRTGRVFTGDRSGEWLYRALYRAGFAQQPESHSRNDGQVLTHAYITCVVKCAPPQNQPSLSEQRRCSKLYLEREIAGLSRAKVWIALGQIALNGLWPYLCPGKSRPKFKHGAIIELPSHQWLLLSYHPSQQNTFTGKLTEPMFDQIFTHARQLLSGDQKQKKSLRLALPLLSVQTED